MRTITRTFSPEDQIAFAQLSGDYNPIHLDPLAARRLIFGRAVVHGMHLVLWALDHWLAEVTGPIRLTALDVNFLRPLGVNEPAEAAVLSSDGRRVKIEATSGGVRLLTLQLAWEPAEIPGPPIAVGSFRAGAPRDREIAELVDASGAIPLIVGQGEALPALPSPLACRFAAMSRSLPGGQIAALLAVSRLIGMEAPGLHSILRAMRLTACDDADAASLAYRVAGHDERFSLLTLNVRGGGLAGTIQAGIRPAPAAQARLTAVRALVGADEFSGQRALVIGGSRGVGRAAALILAAGGADVKLTYHVGADDAQRLVDEIVSGGGAAESFRYDALNDAAKLSQIIGSGPPTLLCYCATPFIFQGAQGRFSEKLLERFYKFYVDGFADAFRAVVSTSDSLRHVLYPSSVAVERVPLAMEEYAAAKSAGEDLCRRLQQAHPAVRFHVPRFPRLATDQTARLQGPPDADAVGEVLKVLWQMR